jgi:hypothetical protein
MKRICDESHLFFKYIHKVDEKMTTREKIELLFHDWAAGKRATSTDMKCNLSGL